MAVTRRPYLLFTSRLPAGRPHPWLQTAGLSILVQLPVLCPPEGGRRRKPVGILTIGGPAGAPDCTLQGTVSTSGWASRPGVGPGHLQMTSALLWSQGVPERQVQVT